MGSDCRRTARAYRRTQKEKSVSNFIVRKVAVLGAGVMGAQIAAHLVNARVGAVLFDHPDPSIYTVLTAPSETPGTANVDFVIFPERWSVAENTFRPPWYHRNIMSEFMGLVHGVYDAKPEGFVPGGMSLHNAMLAHGPDETSFEGASNADLKPVKMEGTLAFMFETRYPQRLTSYASNLSTLDETYVDCWQGLNRHFDPTRKDPV